MVDQGTSNGSYTPKSGQITGNPITVSVPMTSGTNASYTLVFVPQSAIPKTGIIQILVPVEFVLRPSVIRSGGSCTDSDKYICTDVVGQVIFIQA